LRLESAVHDPGKIFNRQRFYYYKQKAIAAAKCFGDTVLIPINP
jgi:hypothetical protein